MSISRWGKRYLSILLAAVILGSLVAIAQQVSAANDYFSNPQLYRDTNGDVWFEVDWNQAGPHFEPEFYTITHQFQIVLGADLTVPNSYEIRQTYGFFSYTEEIVLNGGVLIGSPTVSTEVDPSLPQHFRVNLGNIATPTNLSPTQLAQFSVLYTALVDSRPHVVNRTHQYTLIIPDGIFATSAFGSTASTPDLTPDTSTVFLLHFNGSFDAEVGDPIGTFGSGPHEFTSDVAHPSLDRAVTVTGGPPSNASQVNYPPFTSMTIPINQDYTILSWHKFTEAVNKPGITSFQNGQGTAGLDHLVGWILDSGQVYYYATDVANGISVGTGSPVPGTASATDGNWHHFAVRFTAATQRHELFFDGELVSTVFGAPVAPLNFTTVLFQPNGAGDSIRLFGDEFGLYQRLFSDQEIASAAGRSGTPILTANLTVTAQVFDPGNGDRDLAPGLRKLKGATIELTSGPSSPIPQISDSSGNATFQNILPGTYFAKVSLANENFTVYHESEQTGAVYVEKQVIVSDDSQQSIVIDLTRSCPPSTGCDPSLLSPVIPNDRIDDLAIVYYHMQQVIDFQSERLGMDRSSYLVEAFPVETRLLKVVAFDPRVSGAEYAPSIHQIGISANQSNIGWGGRPMNVEWHEASHELMDLIDGSWQWETFPNNYDTHAGYGNPTTAGSWIEGLATFFPLAIWDYYRELGEVQGPADWYRMGGNPVNMEENRKAWDTEWLTIQREDFAVASMLWDLYDPVDVRDSECGNWVGFFCQSIISDQIDLGANEQERIGRIWGVFTNDSYSIANMRNLWDVLKLQPGPFNPTNEDPDGNGLDFIDELFIMHGFFRDTDPTNRRYNTGEIVAYTCNSSPACDRPSTPYIAGAFVTIEMQDQQGNILTEGNVVIETHYTPPFDYMDFTSSVDLASLESNKVYLEPHAEGTGPTIAIYVVTPDGQRSNSIEFTDRVYRQQLSQAQEQGSEAAIVHTFTQGEDERVTVIPLDVTIDIRPALSTNPINPNSKGVIPVAVLTTPDFDAQTVDPATVRFGRGQAKPLFNKGFKWDLGNDSDIDVIYLFKTQETGIQSGDTAACLTGATASGQQFQGCDAIKIVSKSQSSWFFTLLKFFFAELRWLTEN